MGHPGEPRSQPCDRVYSEAAAQCWSTGGLSRTSTESGPTAITEGIWLDPDPEGGRFLCACARTVMPPLVAVVDAEGRPLWSSPESFPRVYNPLAGESRNAVKGW